MDATRSQPTELGAWAARRPDAEAVVIVDPDSTRPAERITYAALDADADANRLARALRRAGLRRGDRVAFVLGNEPAVFTVFWAAMRTGLYVVPVSRHLLAAEIRYILEDATVSAVIGSEAGAAAWPDAATGLPGLRLTLTVGETLEAALADEAADPVADAE
ncbi:MAG: AMP-binding protein, partial [Acidimicrobiia bacterium]